MVASYGTLAGTVVDADAVVRALNEGRLGGHITDFPTPAMLGRDDCLLLPHLGASTAEAEENCSVMAAEQLMDFLENGNIHNSVNYPRTRMARDGGHRITFANDNVTRVLGSVLSILANHDMNVIDMVNRSLKDMAYNIIDVDSEPEPAIIEAIQAVEDAGEIAVPERALFIRSAVGELERIHSHLLWLGLAGHFIGFNTIWMWAWRFREDVLNILELITGNRNHYGMMKPGGVRRDIKDTDLPAILELTEKPTVAVVKKKPPLSRWLAGAQVSAWSTRLSPADYAELIQGLRRGSRLGSDFVTMLSLATVVASLGLLQDSAAVVIGSMLLAPLMTPMIGCGLALAQANQKLGYTALKTVGAGLICTLVLSYLIGVITPGTELTSQIYARGQPTILDLLVAVASAAAGPIFPMAYTAPC